MANQTHNWFIEEGEHGVLWLRFDTHGAGTNVLSAAVLDELDAVIDTLERRALYTVALIIYSGKDNGFIAGADVTEFTALKTPEAAYEHVRRGQKVFARLAALPFTTVAMIHGFALGGGLELALACDYRVASSADDTKLGFPEVKLGIHPGFGGSIRSVANIGVFAAMDIMLTGRNVHAQRAVDMGLVDKIAGPAQLQDVTARFAANPHPTVQPSPGLKLLQLAPFRPLIARILKKQVARKVNPAHYPAPFALIDLWRKHAGRSAKHYLAEARSIAELVSSDAARNLVRVFLLQNRLKSLGKQSSRTLSHVHVVGAGTMGGDIAAWCAYRGLDVSLQDREQRLIDPALSRGHQLFSRRLKNKHDVEAADARLQADLAGDGVAEADVVIEAIVENGDAKQGLYRELEPKMQTNGLLATNTSSIRLETLAPALKHAKCLVGLHFFNPVAKMPLVEVVYAPTTSTQARHDALAFAARIGKLPVPVKSSPGFLVNRILMPYLLEAIHAADDGIALEAIDKAAVQFGMPMGPIELADTVGLDICQSVGDILTEAYGGTMPTQLGECVSAGHLGRKTGRGFYQYKNGKPIKNSPQPSDITEELQDRLVLPMINEAVACLREGIVEDDELIDAGVIFGTGFAPFRGGPIQYIRDCGVKRVQKRLQALAARYGERFTPDAGWASIQ